MGTIVPYADFQLRQEVKRFQLRLDHDDVFATMFDCALELQMSSGEVELGSMKLLRVESMESWLRTELFRAIRRARLFDACIVSNISYVSRFLGARRAKSVTEIVLSNQMMRYAATADPMVLLQVAEDAFFMYCCFPEHRMRRTVAYRQLALNVGRYAYAHYAAATQTQFGADMADAFEPLGMLSRRLLAPHVH